MRSAAITSLDTDEAYQAALAGRAAFREAVVPVMDEPKLDAIGFQSDGIPVGMELLGRPFTEPTLLAMAAGDGAHSSHHALPPTTSPLP